MKAKWIKNSQKHEITGSNLDTDITKEHTKTPCKKSTFYSSVSIEIILNLCDEDAIFFFTLDVGSTEWW